MRRIVSLMTAAAFSFATPVVAKETSNGVIEGTIRADQPGPILSRHIQGQFAEHLGRNIYDGIWVGPDSAIPNTRGIRRDVVEALKAIKATGYRWIWARSKLPKFRDRC